MNCTMTSIGGRESFPVTTTEEAIPKNPEAGLASTYIHLDLVLRSSPARVSGSTPHGSKPLRVCGRVEPGSEDALLCELQAKLGLFHYSPGSPLFSAKNGRSPKQMVLEFRDGLGRSCPQLVVRDGRSTPELRSAVALARLDWRDDG